MCLLPFFLQFGDASDFTIESNSSTTLGLVLDCQLLPNTNATKTITVAFQPKYTTICLEPVACDVCSIGSDCEQARTDFQEHIANVRKKYGKNYLAHNNRIVFLLSGNPL